MEGHILPQYMSITRSFAEGTIELLGGFQHVPPFNSPGWIIRTRSLFKKYYYVALIIQGFETRIFIVNKVPWQYWDGETSKNKIYQGDRPELYRRLRDAARKKEATKDT